MARFASSLQKKYLEDYAVQHGFDNIQHFSDDGYSGTNFNRPAFNSLLTEIEAGRVGTVIVKDMSRFGRNYLQVGFYTEHILPALWIDDDFLNNEKLEFDYEKFELIDTGIKYLNPKHFSVKSFVEYCRFSKE